MASSRSKVNARSKPRRELKPKETYHRKDEKKSKNVGGKIQEKFVKRSTEEGSRKRQKEGREEKDLTIGGH